MPIIIINNNINKTNNTEYAAMSGVIMVLKDNLRQETFEKILSLPTTFKLLPSEIFYAWYGANAALTLSCYENFCNKLLKSNNKPMVFFPYFNYL